MGFHSSERGRTCRPQEDRRLLAVVDVRTGINAEFVTHVAGSLEAERIARLSSNNILSNKCDDTSTKFEITLFP